MLIVYAREGGFMLQDETLEYIQEQFEEKNMVLEQFGEKVSAYTLYEDIFGDTEQTIPVVFIDEDAEQTMKHIVPMSIDEAMEQCEGRNDMLMGGCTYFNNWISKKSAKDIYTFIIDMDNVYSGTLLNAFTTIIKFIYEVGEGIGSSLRRIGEGDLCPLK